MPEPGPAESTLSCPVAPWLCPCLVYRPALLPVPRVALLPFQLSGGLVVWWWFGGGLAVWWRGVESSVGSCFGRSFGWWFLVVDLGGGFGGGFSSRICLQTSCIQNCCRRHCDAPKRELCPRVASKSALLNGVVYQASLPIQFVVTRSLSLMLVSRRNYETRFTISWACPQLMLR